MVGDRWVKSLFLPQSLAALGLNDKSGKGGRGLEKRFLPTRWRWAHPKWQYKVSRSSSQLHCHFNNIIPCRVGWVISLNICSYSTQLHGYLSFHLFPSTLLAFPAWNSGWQWSSGVCALEIRQATDNWCLWFYSWPWDWLLGRFWPLISCWHLLPLRSHGDNAVPPLQSHLVSSAAQSRTEWNNLSGQNELGSNTMLCSARNKSFGFRLTHLFSFFLLTKERKTSKPPKPLSSLIEHRQSGFCFGGDFILFFPYCLTNPNLGPVFPMYLTECSPSPTCRADIAIKYCTNMRWKTLKCRFLLLWGNRRG